MDTYQVYCNAGATAADNIGKEDGESGDVPTTRPQAGSAADAENVDVAEVDAVNE